MGQVQAAESHFRKVGIRPARVTIQAFGVPSVSFEQNSPQSTANHFVVGTENTPVTVTEVVEPSLSGLVDSLNDGLQRFTRFAWSHFVNPVDELAMALFSWEAQLSAKRVAQKGEALLPCVHD